MKNYRYEIQTNMSGTKFFIVKTNGIKTERMAMYSDKEKAKKKLKVFSE